MAEARKEEKTLMVVEKEEFYVLELTPEEVKFLNTVFNRIGGSPDTSLRVHADRISHALYEAGASESHDDTVIDGAAGRSIYFRSETLGL
jgi:hypothetical protein